MKCEKQTLLDKVSSYENLFFAFKECSRGKRSKQGYQKYLMNFAEDLKNIEYQLKSEENYKWSGYREFFVHDPKKRLVMAAPFKDRIVHTAIHRVIAPIVDNTLCARTYACRFAMGNRLAAQRLGEQLKTMGTKRYCVKLDVKKYFESIPHGPLKQYLLEILPDDTLSKIISSLLDSHPRYSIQKRGIPIGNLTSQLFANLYLSKIDFFVCQALKLDSQNDKRESEGFYIRYMDDIVIIARDKMLAIDIATKAVEIAERELGLEIPSHKFVVLAGNPIPFLGFVFDENGYRVLQRNSQRFTKKLLRAKKRDESLSLVAQMLVSYESWQKL